MKTELKALYIDNFPVRLVEVPVESKARQAAVYAACQKLGVSIKGASLSEVSGEKAEKIIELSRKMR